MSSEGSTRREAEATDVVLRDGSTVSVRPVRADDEPGLLAFLRELSAESVARRFAGSLSTETLRERAGDMATGDGDGMFGIVATSGDDRIVGHAMYARGGRTAGPKSHFWSPIICTARASPPREPTGRPPA